MRRKANLIAGAVCGALCVSSVLAYGAEVQSSFEKERAEVLERYGGEQVEVCVATKDIEVGDVLLRFRMSPPSMLNLASRLYHNAVPAYLG